MNEFLTCSHWKYKIITMTTLSSLAAPELYSDNIQCDQWWQLSLWQPFDFIAVKVKGIHLEKVSTMLSSHLYHEDIMAWQCSLHYWPFERGIHQLLVDSPHKGSVMCSLDGFSIFSLNKLLAAGDLRCHDTHVRMRQTWVTMYLVRVFQWWFLLPYPPSLLYHLLLRTSRVYVDRLTMQLTPLTCTPPAVRLPASTQHHHKHIKPHAFHQQINQK